MHRGTEGQTEERKRDGYLKVDTQYIAPGFKRES